VERRQVPLKIVPDEIARPPGTTTVRFGGGVAQLPNGSQFQIAAGSITVNLDASSLNFTAARLQELAELIRRGTLGMDSSGNIYPQAVSPANPAAPGTAG